MFAGLLAGRAALLRDYFSAISGSAGRLVFSLAYFLALANTLSIPEFGLFATASAAGVMLSRLLAFGFTAPLYRVATIRPRLIGTFTAGFVLLALLSLPLLAAASAAAYLLFFAGLMSPLAFALVIGAEALLWRPLEVVAIVNNGLGRFGRSSVLVIAGTLLRAAAALTFALQPTHTLDAWTGFYAAANGLALLFAAAAFYPRQRLRLRLRLYWPRLPDAAYVAGSEVLFYLQMEFDKLLVLAMAGPRLAGLYAIVMRLVDLTAIPIRTFTMMLVQKLMRSPDVLAGLRTRAAIEAAIFAISGAALFALALLLHLAPGALGKTVAEASTLVMLVLLVPGLRNLVEYHAELLFARGLMLSRAVNLGLLALLKAGLLAALLTLVAGTSPLMLWLNGAFALLYLASAALTYPALRRPAKSV